MLELKGLRERDTRTMVIPTGGSISFGLNTTMFLTNFWVLPTEAYQHPTERRDPYLFGDIRLEYGGKPYHQTNALVLMDLYVQRFKGEDTAGLFAYVWDKEYIDGIHKRDARARPCDQLLVLVKNNPIVVKHVACTELGDGPSHPVKEFAPGALDVVLRFHRDRDVI